MLPPGEGVDAGADLGLGLDHVLGRGRGSGRAQVGHEVRDGVVGLVPDRGDGRNLGGGERPRHPLFVEGPEVLEAAAAAGDDDHVEALQPVEGPDALDDLGRGLLALHARGVDEDLQVRVAPRDDAHDVLDDRARGRGHDADAAGQLRQRPLAGPVEEALLLEFLLQLLERLLE